MPEQSIHLPVRLLVAENNAAYMSLYQLVLGKCVSGGGGNGYNLPYGHVPGYVPPFSLACCTDGDDAVRQVKKALADNRPFAVAFLGLGSASDAHTVDVAEAIRALDPFVEIVVGIEYSDLFLPEFAHRAGPVHKLMFLQKPFHLQEVYHAATALASKWAQEANLRRVHRRLRQELKTKSIDLLEKEQRLQENSARRKQIETELARNELFKTTICDNAAEGILHIDQNFHILFANQAIGNESGMTVQDLIGQRCHQVLAGAVSPCPDCPVRSVAGKDPVRTVVHRRNIPGFPGASHWEYMCLPLMDDQGHTIYFILRRNISARIDAERALEKARQQQQAEYEKRKRISKRLMDFSESERHRIAMELHDHMGYTLSMLRIGFNRLHAALPPTASDLLPALKHLENSTAENLTALKNLAYRLRPKTLEHIGLAGALEALVTDMTANKKLSAYFFSDGVPKNLSCDTALCAYRVAQESLTNILKHADATTVHVSLLRENSTLCLSIEDDGVGFDAKAPETVAGGQPGMGILIMEERALQLGGSFSIDTSPGHGAHLMLKLPIQSPSPPWGRREETP